MHFAWDPTLGYASLSFGSNKSKTLHLCLQIYAMSLWRFWIWMPHSSGSVYYDLPRRRKQNPRDVNKVSRSLSHSYPHVQFPEPNRYKNCLNVPCFYFKLSTSLPLSFALHQDASFATMASLTIEGQDDSEGWSISIHFGRSPDLQYFVLLWSLLQFANTFSWVWCCVADASHALTSVSRATNQQQTQYWVTAFLNML